MATFSERQTDAGNSERRRLAAKWICSSNIIGSVAVVTHCSEVDLFIQYYRFSGCGYTLFSFKTDWRCSCC